MTGTEWLCIADAGGVLLLLMAGMPVALTLAHRRASSSACIGFGTGLFNLLPARIYGVVANYQWLAIPLFVFMGVMLEKSRLADDLLDVVGHIAGGLRGGMALGIIGVGVLMGATTGIVGATVITLGLLTLPTLLKRGYDPGLACGAICASGTLGQIIPPSLILILLSDILQLSVGTLFAAAVMPGLLLAAIYCVYIVIVGMLWPDKVPPIPRAERDAVSRRQLWMRFFKVVVPPVLLVLSVLGSIIGGVAAPTEAASMGALGSILVTGVRRAHVVEGAARDLPVHHQDHRDDDVHPHLRAGILARLPRAARRGPHQRRCSSCCPAGVARRHLVPDAADLRARLLHRVDRDQLHRGAALPAGVRARRAWTWCGSRC